MLAYPSRIPALVQACIPASHTHIHTARAHTHTHTRAHTHTHAGETAKLDEFSALFADKKLVTGTEIALYWNIVGGV